MMSTIDLDESSASMDIDGWRKLNYWSFLFIGIMLISIIVMYYDGGGSSSEFLKMIVYEEIVYFLVRGVFMIRM